MLNSFQHLSNGCKDLSVGFRNKFGMTEGVVGMTGVMNRFRMIFFVARIVRAGKASSRAKRRNGTIVEP